MFKSESVIKKKNDICTHIVYTFTMGVGTMHVRLIPHESHIHA